MSFKLISKLCVFLKIRLSKIFLVLYRAQLRRLALNMLGFWRTTRSRQRAFAVDRSPGNSTPGAVTDISVEGSFIQARTSAQQQRTTADVMRPTSLRGSHPASIRRSPTTEEVCSEKGDTPADGVQRDRSVQTSDELLQPLIDEGLRRRRRPAAADDAQQADNLDHLVCLLYTSPSPRD